MTKPARQSLAQKRVARSTVTPGGVRSSGDAGAVGGRSMEIVKRFAVERKASKAIDFLDPARFTYPDYGVYQHVSRQFNSMVIHDSGLSCNVSSKGPKASDFSELARQTLEQVANKPEKSRINTLARIFERVSSGQLTVRVSVPLSKITEVQREGSADPLAAARARGRAYMQQQYENPDNLALLDAKAYAGRNERSINEMRSRGTLYALLQPGKVRGFRYPKWQFDASAERLSAVLKPLARAGASCWVIHAFMMRAREALAGRTPADAILDESQDLARIVALAQDEIAGDQGAL